MKQFKNWTTEEDKQLLQMLKTYQYTMNDLSEILGRSGASIMSHIRSTGIPYRPVGAGDRRWTDEETLQMIRMRNAGSSTREIAKSLDRSELAINSKLWTLQDKTKNKKFRKNNSDLPDGFFEKSKKEEGNL